MNNINTSIDILDTLFLQLEYRNKLNRVILLDAEICEDIKMKFLKVQKQEVSNLCNNLIEQFKIMENDFINKGEK